MRLLVLLLSFFVTSNAYAQLMVKNDNTDASLLVSHYEAKPGDEITIGLLLQPKEGWHTYWENPGDAGIPTTISWILPEGTNHTEILWPLPSRIQEDVLMVYGYKNDVLLPAKLRVPEDFAGDSFPIRLKAEWLVCDKICVPESAEFAIGIKIAAASFEGHESAILKQELNAIPKKMGVPLPTTITKDSFEIMLPEKVAEDGDLYFFPREQNQILYAAPQKFSGNTLSVARNVDEPPPTKLTGYLESKTGMYDVELGLPGASSPATTLDIKAPPTPPPHSFIVLVLVAILGGLVLNLMPCVLPVLSLKALAIAKKSGRERKSIAAQALAYTAGVLMSFAIIAGVLISLQMAGESIGWGFQMQSPPFVGFLTILLFLVGLNLAGMFELPVLFGSALADTPQHGLRGSFATGVLATAVATPCTAPFMATAVGATLTLPPVLSMLVFLSIGLGLALPFLLIAIFPKLVSYLPRPGAWMETFKQLMAFPMFASVIWLVWVLTQQTGAAGLLIVLITMLALSFIIWLKERCSDRSPFCRIAILLLLLAVLVNGISALSRVGMAIPSHDEEMKFSEAKLSDLRATGTPVFVDATAAWCLTCQVNARTSINTEKSRAAFEETGTRLLIADWTNRDAEITSFLKKFGYNGVPLYVYFPPSGEPVVLPQLLSESLVISTLKGQHP